MAVAHTISSQIRLFPNIVGFYRCFFSGKPRCNEQEICIKTCGNLYRKWRNERKFRTVPNRELNLKITYFDNGNSALKARTPVIVAIHGAPGSYKDFTGLSSYFAQKARVIIPNFPDFTVLQPGIFRFSDEEKAELMKDFLVSISVSHVDALVVHSSGIYPGLRLCLDNELPIKSLIMLNPGTFNFDMKILSHIKIMQKFVKASEIPVFLKVMKYVLPVLLKVGRIPIRTENFLDPLLSATTMVYSNIPEAKAKFLHLSQKKFPMLFAFSKDDKLIGEKSSYELAYLLGNSNEDIYAYNQDGILVNEGKDSAELKVMSFEKGSHYVFWKHPNIIHKSIEDFLRRNMINI